MKLVIYLLISLCFSSIVFADGTRTGIIWPGWRIETSEDYDAPGYPISNMFDGAARSAWVYHFAPDASSFDKLPPNPSPHGVGATITIAQDKMYDLRHLPFFSLDGIGIINGYAKDVATYRRNNRILAIRVSLVKKGGGLWTKTFPLREIAQLQRVNFARQTVCQVIIEVIKVAQGKDDDLCISELAFYDHGARIPWKLTPVVLYNAQNDCGCGGLAFSMMLASGQMCPKEFTGADKVRGVALQPGTSRMLLSTDHAIYLYDLATRKVLFQDKFSGYVVEIGWIAAQTAFITTSTKIFDGARKKYQFSAKENTLRVLAKPTKTFRPLSGSWQPDYGA